MCITQRNKLLLFGIKMINRQCRNIKQCEHALNIQIILVITKKYTYLDKAKISPWGNQKKRPRTFYD